MRRTKIGCVVAALAVAMGPGCKKNHDTGEKPAPAPSVKLEAMVTPAKADETKPVGKETGLDPSLKGKPLVATLQGTEVTFKGGKAYGGFHDGLIIELYDEVVACETSASDNATTLKLELPAGPEQKYMTGHTIALSGAVTSKTPLEYDDYELLMKVEPFAATLNARVKGILAFDLSRPADPKPFVYKAAGSFDVPICNPPPPAVVPASVSGEITGVVKGKAFTIKKALAFTSANQYDASFSEVDAVEFFADAGVTCATAKQATTAFGLRTPGKVLTTKAQLLGSAQPVEVLGARVGDKDGGLVAAGAWAQFDAADLKEGGEIKGSVFLTSDADQKPEYAYKAAGQFTATVCKL